jgi:hypothetical protein
MADILSVRIAGWSTGRNLILDSNTVKFEVAGKCNPFCYSCNDRIAHVDRQLARAGDSVKYRWTSRNLREACYVVLEDTGWEPSEVLSRLGNLLALQIYRG